MPAELSSQGQAVLADLPSYFASDPHALAVLDSLARELGRLEAVARAMSAGMVPHGASDANHLLAVWEGTLDLPVAPKDVSEGDRLATVIAHFRKRRAAQGRDWVALITQALKTESWSHVEVAPYSVTVIIPQSQGTYAAEQLKTLVRKITPANLGVNIVYDRGFLVGLSQIGIRAL